MNHRTLDRRRFLKGLSLSAAGALTASSLGGKRALAQSQPQDPRFLIVLGGTGGASLIDSFLAIRESESQNAATINAYPDAAVQSIDGTPFRAIDRTGPAVGAIPAPFQSNQSAFVQKHASDMMVATMTGTSVNHAVAQKRALTGNEAWAGRTLQELVALQYGEGLALANVAMATGTSFIQPGTDRSLPTHCYPETVATPALWPLSLHGTRGLDGPNPAFVNMANKVRDDKLDPESKFAQVFAENAKLKRWVRQRQAQAQLETQDLIQKLMLYPDSPEYPLTQYGLAESDSGPRVREAFPRFNEDPLEAQAALAFLLLKNRVSVSVSIGPSFNAALAEGAGGDNGFELGDLINTPIAFDFSHQAHRDTQALMWTRVLSIADRLIDLLKSEEFSGGQSFWDRSLIYVATDFGRDKIRPANADAFGTSHHLNNGILAISPMVRGNTVLGGVDPNTGLTYGFNPQTGAPEPGREMTEPEIFSGLLGALGVETTGANLPSVPAMRRS